MSTPAADAGLLQHLLEWGWAAVGSLVGFIGFLGVGRIRIIEADVKTKASMTDLKELGEKHDKLREDMHEMFRDQTNTILAAINAQPRQ